MHDQTAIDTASNEVEKDSDGVNQFRVLAEKEIFVELSFDALTYNLGSKRSKQQTPGLNHHILVKIKAFMT